MSESKVVTAYIAPIRADKLKITSLDELAADPEPVTVEVSLEIPGIHAVQLESRVPLVVREDSLEYAETIAESIVAKMSELPHTAFAGDMLALAFAVLHYRQGT
jgi:hypothetical protein